MKLLLLGTSGYHPNDRRHTACMMLPELGVVLDAGTAMYRVGDHLSTDTLDIYLTHAHLDHIIGLTYMFNVVGDRPMKHVVVHGLETKLAAVREHLFAKPLFPVDPPFEMKPIETKEPIPGGGTITHFPLRHPGGAIGYRIDWPDRSMAYVSDTLATTDSKYIEKIRGVDLLIHECFFFDDQPEQAELTGHSCALPTAEVAALAEVGRMVLVHINPNDHDEQIDLTPARRIFKNIELGTDLMEIDF